MDNQNDSKIIDIYIVWMIWSEKQPSVPVQRVRIGVTQPPPHHTKAWNDTRGQATQTHTDVSGKVILEEEGMIGKDPAAFSTLETDKNPAFREHKGTQWSLMIKEMRQVWRGTYI